MQVKQLEEIGNKIEFLFPTYAGNQFIFEGFPGIRVLSIPKYDSFVPVITTIKKYCQQYEYALIIQNMSGGRLSMFIAIENTGISKLLDLIKRTTPPHLRSTEILEVFNYIGSKGIPNEVQDTLSKL